MKKLTLTIVLLALMTLSYAQSKKEQFGAYKPSTEAQDNWKKSEPKTGLENYGITSTKKNSYTKEQTHRFIGGIVGIFAAALSVVIYTKIQKAANEIN